MRGSEQAGTRLALIVSTEAVNRTLPILTILPLTTFRPGRRIYPAESFLAEQTAGQSNTSIVMAHQIRTLAKDRLLTTIGRLDDEALRSEVRNALRTHLDRSKIRLQILTKQGH